ncbi:hypothetical protein EOD41_10765 [Mucilaginibacter limnophilus]|uniref:Uncharacterized protein n=1 Tax=Mucilaginibacter limnophilus TaxID=1932778 RepID=A0A3S2V8C8_9SPHI|nr:hypothetical protein [Mucilaginibacter limnophilus]RVU01087.1 hypothetical protein EOD41_10765 [Mucilaginibacter limnophilus]
MKQMHVDDQYVVKADLTGYAAIFNPVVFKDGDSYCALLGPDPQDGVFGCGCSVDEAVRDWNDHVQAIVDHPEPTDEVTEFVIIKLKEHGELPEDI